MQDRKSIKEALDPNPSSLILARSRTEKVVTVTHWGSVTAPLKRGTVLVPGGRVREKAARRQRRRVDVLGCVHCYARRPRSERLTLMQRDRKKTPPAEVGSARDRIM